VIIWSSGNVFEREVPFKHEDTHLHGVTWKTGVSGFSKGGKITGINRAEAKTAGCHVVREVFLISLLILLPMVILLFR